MKFKLQDEYENYKKYIWQNSFFVVVIEQFVKYDFSDDDKIKAYKIIVNNCYLENGDGEVAEFDMFECAKEASENYIKELCIQTLKDL